jgi:phospholipid N-methyltransferase
LEEAPKIENPKLVKGVMARAPGQAGGNSAANEKSYQEIDILIKLIPFFDIPMAKSSKIIPEAT